MKETLVVLIIAVVLGAMLNASGLFKNSGHGGEGAEIKSNLPQLNDTNFKQEVLDSKTPVLVDFWAPWCGPCRSIAPEIEEIAKDYGTKLKVVKVDVDQAQVTGMTYNVQAIPNLCMFKGGKLVDRIQGAAPKDMVSGMIDKNL